ncbi:MULTISPECIES: hypothetical protein [unclassified Arthrobacter]|uniref:hypothetical protein n=1 Tax=unclassified Arthrobacter TaxID=235627 RepID=UPI001E3AFED7|nr:MULTISPECIES: hypothetical protein [unclassified Arthrobacter]MCC9146205.1 hypothetical protein [Arthrobacter sp. zg-Y919]MDK1277435.1 hypothetical protein [Arthrobacter sp. zg.Y919]WIB03929.1 hypothetical protein QNO10_04470 [Arthrobacter sp. zg-Y919]
MMEERGSRWWKRLLVGAAVPVTAGALVVAGVVLAVTAPRPDSFGWFAYSPLQDGSQGPGNPMLVTGTMRLGYLLAVLGLVVAAFWAGLRIGRRPVRTAEQTGS